MICSWKKLFICGLSLFICFSFSTGSQAAVKKDSGGYIIGQKLPKKPYYKNGVLIVNKQHPLPKKYAPGESKTARKAFNQMATAARKSGHRLTAFSTYRSFSRQQVLYANYKKRDGQKAADRYSARAGYSEHQSGLGFDIGDSRYPKHFAENSFAKTRAAKWLAKHAHEYGFVLRYPKGKEKITGYMYESWHFRYVGKSLAKKIHAKNVTMEEYFNIVK